MNLLALSVLGTLLALSSGQNNGQTATSKPVTKPVSKPKNFWDELGNDFLNLGRSLAVKAVGGLFEIGCNRGCPRLCEDRYGRFVCEIVCAPCFRGKRSTSQAPHKGHLTPMPNKFSAYDINDDGVVSMKELAFVTGPGTTEKDISVVFGMADTNGDKVLTPKELYEGPFVFEMDVGDSDYMYCQHVQKRMNRKYRGGSKPTA